MPIPVESIISSLIIAVAILIFIIGFFIMLGSFLKGLQTWAVAGFVGAIGMYWFLNPIIDPTSTIIADGVKCSWELYRGKASLESATDCLEKAQKNAKFPASLILSLFTSFIPKPKKIKITKTTRISQEEPIVSEVPETLTVEQTVEVEAEPEETTEALPEETTEALPEEPLKA